MTAVSTDLASSIDERWVDEVLPTLTALRSRGDAIVEGLLAENSGRWESLSERDAERVSALAHAVVPAMVRARTLPVVEVYAFFQRNVPLAS